MVCWDIYSIKRKLWVGDALGYLFEHLVSEPTKCVSDVRYFFLYYLFQQWSQLAQSCVVLVVEPRFDENSVVWLQLEVFSHVVDNDSLGKISSNPR